MKRWLALSLALALVFISLAACGGGKTEEPSGTSGTSGTDSGGTQNSAMVDGKYDPPVTITTVGIIGGDIKYKDGESIEDNVHLRWAKEKLGIDIKYLWTTNGSLETKLRLALSANQEMPDILALRNNAIQDLIDSGKFQEVGELFEKYASPTWKAAMNEDPTVWHPFMRDGKKFAIPILDYSYNGDPVLWIREDWMNKFNLQAPKTIADLEKILDTFANQDPDGNGQKDTYGLTIGFGNSLNTWMADAGWIFGAYGAMPSQWNKDANGGLEYGSINPGVKQGLAKIKEWMDKGYLPKEAGLWDEGKATELFTAGKAGIVAGPHWMPWWPLEDVKKNVPGAEYRAYPIPAGPDGKAGRHGTPNFNGAVLINKNMKNPEAFFTYQNYLFENYANPQPGSEFEYGLAQGYDWDIVDGKPVTLPEGQGGIAVKKYTLTFDGARIPSLSMNILAKLARGEEPETPAERKAQDETPTTALEAAKIVLDQKDIVMMNMFTGAPTETMNDKNELLGKMEKEAFSKIIYGKVGLDEFDNFVANWKKAGGDTITNEVNEWYQQVGGK
ncbi:extracellular solute-binding protein [Paenibacillus thermotolerans]|uniref:extracellular solute-binding protein n=1 Tax=Paenibacillus thermotolerans TaxID=3027807 RepID=UPI0023675F65|nr:MULTISPECIES: extracellular solute-binding protein [unclassified Paenibacillus]